MGSPGAHFGSKFGNTKGLNRSRDPLLLWMFGWVGGCLCVSDPRFIQFALGCCYAVHINALSIELKCTSKGTMCRLN